MGERFQVEATGAPGPDARSGEGRFACVLGAWRAHEGELRGFLVNRLRDEDGAEDLLQETFLRALREGEGFCRLDDPRAWLFRVARNAAVDRARRRRPSVPLDEDIAEPERAPPPVDALGECLERSLPALSPGDRRVIEACDLGGVRQRDFATDNGIGLNAVKSRLLRARRRLREQLESRCRVQFDEGGRVCCYRSPADEEA